MPLRAEFPDRPLQWPAVVNTLQQVVSCEQEVFLVGGAVRDAYLQRPLKDIDLATRHDGRPLARRIANQFKGAYYPLDASRGVGRAIVPWQDSTVVVDVAQFRGENLLEDLQKRDFTINALAVDLCSDLAQVIDPMGGLGDLRQRLICQCQPSALLDDPIRILRAVRASTTFGFVITPDTRVSMKAHAARLASASAERIRDEFMQILGSPNPAAAVDVMARLDILMHVLPEQDEMSELPQSPPHYYDVWRHTLAVVEHMDRILSIFSGERDDNTTGNVQHGLVAWTLNVFRDQLEGHIAYHWPDQRSHRSLLILAGLLHDVGKPRCKSVDEDGRLRFLRHEIIGEEIAAERCTTLRLSGDECKRIAQVVRHHMRPFWLGGQDSVSVRAVHRYWRDTGAAGVDICLLSAADFLATYGPFLDHRQWIAHLEVLRTLLEGYFNHYDSIVSPAPIISGSDLIRQLGVSPGPEIGRLLEAVRELQVEGQISTKKEALDWVKRSLER